MVREDDAVGSFFKDYDNFYLHSWDHNCAMGTKKWKVYGEENNILYWAD